MPKLSGSTRNFSITLILFLALFCPTTSQILTSLFVDFKDESFLSSIIILILVCSEMMEFSGLTQTTLKAKSGMIF